MMEMLCGVERSAMLTVLIELDPIPSEIKKNLKNREKSLLQAQTLSHCLELRSISKLKMKPLTKTIRLQKKELQVAN